METVRTIKEKSCYVALNPAKEEKELLASSSAAAAAAGSSKGGAGGDSRVAGGGRSGVEEFRLPDGRVIKVSRPGLTFQQAKEGLILGFVRVSSFKLGSERYRAPEILFNPELIGQESVGVHQLVVDSISRADLDLRRSLFSNVVLSGGTTLCKGPSPALPQPFHLCFSAS